MAGGRGRPKKEEKPKVSKQLQSDDETEEELENESAMVEANEEDVSIGETEDIEDEPVAKQKVKSNKVKKVINDDKKNSKGKKPKRVESFSSYIYKVLKQVHPETGISGKAMSIMNNFVNDMFERIANESMKLASISKRPTMSSREIQTSVRLLLPVANIRINGKVNLTAHFDQEERLAMVTQNYQSKADPKINRDPYETIKIIQKNLISDFEEIIAEKKIYAYLLHTDIKSPLYHIEKLSELVGKAKAIIKSKVYKIDRRAALQKAINLFDKVKNRLSTGILDELKKASLNRQISETNTQYDDSPRLERNFSAQEVFSRNIVDSLNLNRQRLECDNFETISIPSDKSESNKSDDETDYYKNLWSRNRFVTDNTQMPMMCQQTPCISPPLPMVTPHLPELPGATSSWIIPEFPQKSSDSQLPKESTIYDNIFSGHFPTPNVHLDEIESIQATLKDLGNFENYDGKSSDSSDSNCDTKHYYYVDGELTEFTHPKNKKPNQSIDGTEASHNSSRSENDDWKFLKLTQENLAKFDKSFEPTKKLAAPKVEATKRKIDDNIKDDRNPKKNKTDQKKVKKIKLVREKKFYVKESAETCKIMKKYK
ncbi:uncharacterized protein [Chironomus tepperi]|uniref:uncharacterized protein n=1 Tax=Chironomus tepperi TaxID=113505 RepID=UPI00391F09F8